MTNSGPWTKGAYPAKMRRWLNVGLLLGRHRSETVQPLMFAGYMHVHNTLGLQIKLVVVSRHLDPQLRVG